MPVVYFTTKKSFLVCSQTVLFIYFYLRDFSKREVPDIFVDKSETKNIFLVNVTNAICTTLLALVCVRFICTCTICKFTSTIFF